jgi:hypothetical protein
MSDNKFRKIMVISSYNCCEPPFFQKGKTCGVTFLHITSTFPFITSSWAPTSPQDSPPLCCCNSYRNCHVVTPPFCSRGIRNYENLSSTRVIRNTSKRKSQRDAPERSWCLNRSQFLFFFHSFVLLLLFHPLFHIFPLLRLGFH